jgi:hypothetical protein
MIRARSRRANRMSSHSSAVHAASSNSSARMRHSRSSAHTRSMSSTDTRVPLRHRHSRNNQK